MTHALFLVFQQQAAEGEFAIRALGPLAQILPFVAALLIVGVAFKMKRKENVDRGLWRRRLWVACGCMALCSVAFIARGVEAVYSVGRLSPTLMGPLLEGAAWWLGFAGVAALLVAHLLGER